MKNLSQIVRLAQKPEKGGTRLPAPSRRPALARPAPARRGRVTGLDSVESLDSLAGGAAARMARMASPARSPPASPNDYEATRQANILRNELFLQQLQDRAPNAPERKVRKRPRAAAAPATAAAPRGAPSSARAVSDLEERARNFCAVRRRFPHREAQVGLLEQVLEGEVAPNALLVTGPGGSGKFQVVHSALRAMGGGVLAASVECSSATELRTLFQSILWQLEGPRTGKVPACASFPAFRNLLEERFGAQDGPAQKLAIVLRRAEQLDVMVLRRLCLLQQLLREQHSDRRLTPSPSRRTPPRLLCVFVSASISLPAALQELHPFRVHFPAYTAPQTAHILLRKLVRELQAPAAEDASDAVADALVNPPPPKPDAPPAPPAATPAALSRTPAPATEGSGEAAVALRCARKLVGRLVGRPALPEDEASLSEATRSAADSAKSISQRRALRSSLRERLALAAQRGFAGFSLRLEGGAGRAASREPAAAGGALGLAWVRCRDVRQLLRVSLHLLPKMVRSASSALAGGAAEAEAVEAAWRATEPECRDVLEHLFVLGGAFGAAAQGGGGGGGTAGGGDAGSALGMPYEVKMVVIAAFIASRNAADKDWAVFAPRRGGRRKKKRRRGGAKRKDEGLSAAFPLERLLSIFQALLAADLGSQYAARACTSGVAAQVASLCRMGLLRVASGADREREGSASAAGESGRGAYRDRNEDWCSSDPPPFYLGSLAARPPRTVAAAAALLRQDLMLRYGATEDLAFRLARTIPMSLDEYLVREDS